MLLLCGCQSLFYTPAFVLSLHDFANQSLKTGLQKQVRDINHEYARTIARFPFLDARGFYDGELTGPDAAGRYGLRLRVDRWHVAGMNHAATNEYGMRYAVIVDGSYIGFSVYNRSMRDTDICEIDPIFNQHDAEHILKNLRDNFDYYQEK